MRVKVGGGGGNGGLGSRGWEGGRGREGAVCGGEVAVRTEAEGGSRGRGRGRGGVFVGGEFGFGCFGGGAVEAGFQG